MCLQMLQKTENHPGLAPGKSCSVLEKGPKGLKALGAKCWAKLKERGKESDEKENGGVKGILDFTVLLTNLMTLLAWRTMDLAKAEYEGKAFTYW